MTVYLPRAVPWEEGTIRPAERTVQDVLSTQGGEERDAKTRAENYHRKALAADP